MKSKYIYDINLGHFIKVINEDDNTNTQDNSSSETENNTLNNLLYKSIESNTDILDINNSITTENDKFSKELNTLEQLLNQAKKNAANKQVTSDSYDPVATDTNVLSLLKKINDLKKQHYNTLWQLEDKRLQVLATMSKTNESLRTDLPEKYRWLNESNIHTAKIYMGDLVGQDENSILKGMADFKRTFKDTNLLYGKDRQGYFLIILDQDDMDVMYDTLDEVGYLRDDIISTVMPLLLDRSKLIL